jgi:DNA-binding transcriptional regulator YiaG
VKAVREWESGKEKKVGIGKQYIDISEKEEKEEVPT